MTDDEFFITYSDAVIGLLADYALSPEFKHLKFRVTRNDAFNYVILYFSTDAPFSDYPISVRFGDSKFWLSYTTWDIPLTQSKQHEFAVDNLDALRAHLEPLKPFIVDMYQDIAVQWEDIMSEIENGDHGEDE